ncbi:hypothetical protein NDU88_009769 [Pleurodeles waltl]|uniref:Uncharacterized protein n=1 Tax=Pleurodeles waltl TaxID=8319 RepID=A0AAV7PW65_PLEWA|nr:hypothetical protein NDU88_009769 [Pleurodeles waltl]
MSCLAPTGKVSHKGAQALGKAMAVADTAAGRASRAESPSCAAPAYNKGGGRHKVGLDSSAVRAELPSIDERAQRRQGYQFPCRCFKQMKGRQLSWLAECSHIGQRP